MRKRKPPVTKHLEKKHCVRRGGNRRLAERLRRTRIERREAVLATVKRGQDEQEVEIHLRIALAVTDAFEEVQETLPK